MNTLARLSWLRRAPVLWLCLGLISAFAADQQDVGAEKATSSSEKQVQPEKNVANKLKLLVGKQPLWVEVAVTPAQQQRGLMYRTKMEENVGMLFVFPAPKRASVWMKNTILPLSCAFLDNQGKILEIKDLNSLDEKVMYSKQANVRFMLETHREWFSDNNLAEGDLVVTERGSLAMAFGLR
jgi:hypothetical protein